MTTLDFILAILFGALTLGSAPEETRKRLEAQLAPAPLAKNVACEYGSWMLANVGHEYGHALAIKAFTGNLPTIHLGTHKKDAQPLFSIGNVSFEGFNQTQGYTDIPTLDQAQLTEEVRKRLAQNPSLRSKLERLVKLTAEKLSPLSDNQLKAVLLAGGFAGAGTQLALQAAGKVLGVNPYPLHIDALICHQLFNALLPMGTDNDAAKLLKKQFNISDTQLNTISNVTALIYLYSFIYTTINDPRNDPNTPRETLIMVGVVNFYLRGVARFHG